MLLHDNAQAHARLGFVSKLLAKDALVQRTDHHTDIFNPRLGKCVEDPRNDRPIRNWH